MQIPDRFDPTLNDDSGTGRDLVDYKREASNRTLIAPPRFPLSDMASLYQRVRAACPTDQGCVIQVIGPHPRTGVTSIVHGIGRVAAELSGQRVLLCDGTGSGDLLCMSSVVMRRSNLERLVVFEGVSIRAGLVSCHLDEHSTQHEMIARVGRYAESLRKFRSVFDLVVVDVPASNVSDLGPALAKHVDAVIVVVEAEKTRAPLIKSLVSVIQGNGGNVAGLVMNKRVQHIPKRVYRWL
jgi:hypothetical protein